MLRIHFLQQWLNLSDPAMEEALYDTPMFREFAGLDIRPGKRKILDKSTPMGAVKAEYYHLEMHDGIATLEAGVHDYIRNYNHERIKLGLQGLSPVEYRLRNTA